MTISMGFHVLFASCYCKQRSKVFYSLIGFYFNKLLSIILFQQTNTIAHAITEKVYHSINIGKLFNVVLLNLNDCNNEKDSILFQQLYFFCNVFTVLFLGRAYLCIILRYIIHDLQQVKKLAQTQGSLNSVINNSDLVYSF